uniref:Uncharacterized protein n=1 Tax=Oryza sativa subsp. japonica TaxID=39947 RepID=Q9FRG0_ORYSJ|nr:hypothetical protein [Oryza sativa Japonica Group]
MITPGPIEKKTQMIEWVTKDDGKSIQQMSRCVRARWSKLRRRGVGGICGRGAGIVDRACRDIAALEEENCRSEHEEDEGCVIACAGTEDGCFPALNSPRIDLAGGAS